MSGNSKRRFIETSKERKKISAKGLKNLLNAIGRKIFSKVHRNEVEYGQTLSKKRRKNCILKSVSSLPSPNDDDRFLISSPYHIKFKFSKDENHRLFHGSVKNFHRTSRRQSCCEKCNCNFMKSESLSKFSISSDSACDVSSSASSCDDLQCIYREIPKKLKRRRSKSASDIPKKGSRTIENFIRIHNENFTSGFLAPNNEEDFSNDTEHSYESLINSLEDSRTIDDSDYDILLTKSDYRVMEPYYENLKVIENFCELPNKVEFSHETLDKVKEKTKSHKTYDEVIQSLKLWHLNSKHFDEVQRAENALNHRLEGYEALDNDLNNHLEEFGF